ncbi:DUF721 domain-containing protein [Salinarimonas ramus]|uniref:DUF721 domain-containing protein n=1 Tax=Salinarimonas ramus TaxID=690164 RepID=A0A917QAA8_9HYPH|nr:DciA family protein [Salinarimonas ramus]GGK39317.1 hypothetical protein GCM10011322_28040 [Salinarimonas ramus]
MARQAYGSRPLAELVDGAMGEALARQGFASADVIAAWPDIAGDPLGTYSQPVKLEWPKRARPEPDAAPPPATLVILVESAFALDAQHMAPLLIERINALYGWGCVGKIVLKQGPVRRPPPRRPPARPLAPGEEAAIAGATGSVEDASLRDALARLGREIVSRQGRAR